MKKYILILFIVALPLFVRATNISYQAWSNLRDIHAWHLENVDGIKWDPQTAYTDAFLERTIKPYFFQLVDENKKYKEDIARFQRENEQYKEEVARLQQENEQLRATNTQNTSSKNSFLITSIILGVLLFAILFIPLFFILKSKKRTATQTASSGGCPRCGMSVDLSKGKCPNCGTHV